MDYRTVQVGDELLDLDIKRAVDEQLAGKGLRRVEIGKLTIGQYDPASKQLVWRGAVSKTLNISKDPDKNYRNLREGYGQAIQKLSPRDGKRSQAVKPHYNP